MHRNHVNNGTYHQQIDEWNVRDVPQREQTRISRVLSNPGDGIQILRNQFLGLFYPPHKIGLTPLLLLREPVQNGAQVRNAASIGQPLGERKPEYLPRMRQPTKLCFKFTLFKSQ